MNIAEKMKKETTLSFEIFPPRTAEGMTRLLPELPELEAWHPDWISCTYGARGSDKGYNLELCRRLVEGGTETVTHYTCIHHSKEEILRDMDEYEAMGVTHVLSLRGDFVPGETDTGGDFHYASELIDFLRRARPQLTQGCTGIPESHISSPSLESDTAFLKRKQDLGAEFIVTQLTFDMERFKRWLEEIRTAGVTIPVSVGVMPVLERDKCIRHCLSMNGCAIPRELARHISRYYDDPAAFRELGMDYTVRQIYQYMALGVNDLHIYTLNEAGAVSEILRRCGLYNSRR